MKNFIQISIICLILYESSYVAIENKFPKFIKKKSYINRRYF